MRASIALCAAIVAALACAPNFALAHGYLASPRARNVVANSDYCQCSPFFAIQTAATAPEGPRPAASTRRRRRRRSPAPTPTPTPAGPHCLSAGGPGIVSGGQTWPAGAHGLGGDPASAARPRNHEAGGKYWGGGAPQATWVEGSVVSVSSTLTAFHRGRLGYRVCRVEGTSVAAETAQLTEACLEANVLRQANVPGAQAPGDRWFHLGSTPIPAPMTYTAALQLPPGLVCDGVTAKCVLQWYYVSEHSAASLIGQLI